MKVKVIDEQHELDLEDAINEFLEENEKIIDIKFSTSSFVDEEKEQIFCFSAMILYE